MLQKESPIFIKSYDLLRWLVPATLKFPKSQRFVLAKQIQETAFTFYDALVQAGKGVAIAESLRDADVALERLRLYIRLGKDLGLFGPQQYEHVARQMADVGRLLGAWLKKARQIQPEAGSSGETLSVGKWA